MTLSKEIRRFVLPGLMLSACMSGQLAAAPGFVSMRPAFGVAPRPVVVSRPRLGLRGDGDQRRGGRDGQGRFAGGGVGIAVLPVVSPAEPAVAVPIWQDGGTIARADERWAWDERPERASCIRPLIIDLRPPPKTRQPDLRVLYGTAPPICPRS